jgi:predicted nucleic acid-binding protein
VIVLDTNVLSEPLRSKPDAAVIEWIQTVQEDLALTSISVGEIFVGVRLLPSGKRRTGLMSAIETTLSAFTEQVLIYDDRAARTYARLHESRRGLGRPLGVEDGMIAAICLTRHSKLATRNVRNFENLGLELINPWER